MRAETVSRNLDIRKRPILRAERGPAAAEHAALRRDGHLLSGFTRRQSHGVVDGGAVDRAGFVHDHRGGAGLEINVRLSDRVGAADDDAGAMRFQITDEIAGDLTFLHVVDGEAPEIEGIGRILFDAVADKDLPEREVAPRNLAERVLGIARFEVDKGDVESQPAQLRQEYLLAHQRLVMAERGPVPAMLVAQLYGRQFNEPYAHLSP